MVVSRRSAVPPFLQSFTTAETMYEKRPAPTITVHLQPEEVTREMPRVKTVRQLLDALSIRSCTALVARDGELLTPDRQIMAGDSLLVRKVTSSG